MQEQHSIPERIIPGIGMHSEQIYSSRQIFFGKRIPHCLPGRIRG